jgi:hypothetical protein
MRLSAALALVVAVIVFAGLVWGLSALLLASSFAVPLVFVLYVAAESSEPRWRVQMYLVMWTIARPVAFFMGSAAWGWPAGVALFLATFIFEVIARVARRRAAS